MRVTVHLSKPTGCTCEPSVSWGLLEQEARVKRRLGTTLLGHSGGGGCVCVGWGGVGWVYGNSLNLPLSFTVKPKTAKKKKKFCKKWSWIFGAYFVRLECISVRITIIFFPLSISILLQACEQFMIFKNVLGPVKAFPVRSSELRS